MKLLIKIIICSVLLLKTFSGYSQDTTVVAPPFISTAIDTSFYKNDSTPIKRTPITAHPVRKKSAMIATVSILGFSGAMLEMWNQSENKSRGAWVAGGNIAAYGGMMVGLYNLWYKKYPQSKFHFFNDNKEWLQIDKVGHMYSSYTEGRVGMELWKWAGVPKNNAIWFGGLTGLAYQGIIETLDGYSAEWGFSWGDMLANIAGSALLISQELAWGEQRVQMRFSTHLEQYPNDAAHIRVKELFGTKLPERVVKDYNAQSYWLAINYASFFKDKDHLPNWLPISVGYGGQNMFGAFVNMGEAKGLKRYRQWYISPDIDLTKIKTNSDLLNALFFTMTLFHFPAPAIEIANHKVKFHWFHL